MASKNKYTSAELNAIRAELNKIKDSGFTKLEVVHELRKEIQELLDRGLTYQDISERLAEAKVFDISKHTLKSYLLSADKGDISSTSDGNT